MQYTRPSFSAAVSNGSISDTAYEVAVGLRCADCGNLMADGHLLSCAIADPADLPIGACDHGNPIHYLYPCPECVQGQTNRL